MLLCFSLSGKYLKVKFIFEYFKRTVKIRETCEIHFRILLVHVHVLSSTYMYVLYTVANTMISISKTRGKDPRWQAVIHYSFTRWWDARSAEIMHLMVLGQYWNYLMVCVQTDDRCNVTVTVKTNVQIRKDRKMGRFTWNDAMLQKYLVWLTCTLTLYIKAERGNKDPPPPPTFDPPPWSWSENCSLNSREHTSAL